jgi:hypothetical protein
MILLIPILLGVLFFAYAGMVMWFFWALAEVDLINDALTFSDSCTVAAPLFVFVVLAAAFSRD